jgi:hypothetical protein
MKNDEIARRLGSVFQDYRARYGMEIIVRDEGWCGMELVGPAVRLSFELHYHDPLLNPAFTVVPPDDLVAEDRERGLEVVYEALSLHQIIRVREQDPEIKESIERLVDVFPFTREKALTERAYAVRGLLDRYAADLLSGDTSVYEFAKEHGWLIVLLKRGVS